MRYVTYWVRLLAAALAAAMLLAGCGRQPVQPAVPSAPAPTETVPVSLPAADGLRQAMEGTPQFFAAAYFGYTAVDSNMELRRFMEQQAPRLWAEQPLLAEIPDARIVGGSVGELYCIVPLDPDADVTVSRATANVEGEYRYDEEIYHGSGEPILLLANSADMIPDTQVTIRSDRGEAVWYPQLADSGVLAQLWSDSGDGVILDFSPYAECMARNYFDMTDYGWRLPQPEELAGKAWGAEHTLRDGRCVSYLMDFGPETVRVRWNDGIDPTDHEFPNAAWSLEHREGFAVLTVDFREFAGVLRYDLMYDPDEGWLYTMVDVSQGTMQPGNEMLTRYLSPCSVEPPDPMDLAGTWELTHSSEGSRLPGDCVVVISGGTPEEMTIRCTDHADGRFDFADKALAFKGEELYAGCGNRDWVADVVYVGEDETTYCLTLLEDGMLLLRKHTQAQGQPQVSYQWYRRVD